MPVRLNNILGLMFRKRVFAKRSVCNVSAPGLKIMFRKPVFPKRSVCSVCQAYNTFLGVVDISSPFFLVLSLSHTLSLSLSSIPHGARQRDRDGS